MDLKNTEFYSGFSGVKVHPNAFVDPNAELHDGVIISQGAVVGPDVIIGKGSEIGPNAVISGRTQIGINNKVFPSVFIGLDPQDLKYKGAPLYLRSWGSRPIKTLGKTLLFIPI